MTARMLRPEFFDDIVERADVGLLLAGYRPSFRRTLVERGLYRAQGGQSMARPEGITEDVRRQIVEADAAQDAELLDPTVAAAIVMVGMHPAGTAR